MAAVGLAFPVETFLSKPFVEQIFPRVLIDSEYLSW
jgi:hypothetical protein